MNLKKAYCGLMFVEFHHVYFCVDKYTNEIKKRGTYEECNEYFNTYVDKISRR